MTRMYPVETHFPSVSAHRSRSGSTPPTFSDVGQRAIPGVAGLAGISSHHAGHRPNRQIGQPSDRYASWHSSNSIRVSRDVSRNLPHPDNSNRQPPPMQRPSVSPEVIDIYHDEPPAISGTVWLPLAPPPPARAP